MTMDNEQWLALLARASRVRREARALAEAAKPIRFRGSDGRMSLVSPDLNYPPESGIWRVTWFCLDGQPVGHWECGSAYAAFHETLNSGAMPIIRESVTC